MLNCIFCNKECKNNNSLLNHQNKCPCNPNRVYINGMAGKKHSVSTKEKMSVNNKSKLMSQNMRLEYAERARKRNEEYFSLEENRKKYSIMACNRLCKHSKYSKNIEYNGVILESSYEHLFALQLDELKIAWKKCHGVRFEYTDSQGKIRGYIPDFYLKDFNLYIDTKNDYLIKKDAFKINSVVKENTINLIVFSLTDIINKKILEIIPTIAQGEQGAL